MNYYLQYAIYLTIIGAGFITGSIFYKKTNHKILPVIIILIYTFISQSGSMIGATYFRNNIPIEHLYMMVSTSFWGWFFYINIEAHTIRRVVKWLTIALVIFYVINTLFIQHINTLPSNSMKLATLFNLVWGSFLLIQMLDLPGKQNVFTNPFFLVVIALVWFNIISSFHFFVTGFLFKYQLYSPLIGYIHLFSNYIYYLILFIAMFFLKKFNQNAGTLRI